jgi:hypothetical protein
MAFDDGLAERVRESLGERPDLEEKRMFGGVAFMLNGNLACGILDDNLIVRVGPNGYADALAEPHVREFDITGRSMTGWVMVGPDGTEDDAALAGWIGAGVTFALTLPPK